MGGLENWTFFMDVIFVSSLMIIPGTLVAKTYNISRKSSRLHEKSFELVYNKYISPPLLQSSDQLQIDVAPKSELNF